MNAHSYESHTFSTIYAIDKSRDIAWIEATEGLPSTNGTLISAVTERDGIFYIANNKGIFSSDNGGKSWHPLNITWPNELTEQHVYQLITLD